LRCPTANANRMSEIFGALVVSLVVSLTGAQANAGAGQPPSSGAVYGAPSNGFDLSISAAEAQFHAGSPLVVTLRLRNNGPDVNIRWDYPGPFEFTMYDSRGRIVQQVVTKADIIIGGHWSDGFSTGQIKQHTFDLSGRYQLGSGDYRIRASTKLYDPGPYGTDPSGWKLIAEPTSNEITIHVSS
jgi:hypothetical protein